MSDIVETLSTHVFPMLRNLAISIFDFRPNDVRSNFASLPDNIIRENIPRLTSLSVNGMLFNWTIIQGLRVLRVVFEGTYSVAFSFEDIIDALKRNPLLEEFEIRLPWRIIPRISISSDTVSLPRLTSIRIHGIVQLSSSLLHSLASVPHSASIYVDDKTPNATEIQHNIFVLEDDAPPEQGILASYAALLAYFSQHVKQDHGPVIQTVSLRQTMARDFSGQIIFHIRIAGSLRADQYREPGPWDPESVERVFVGIATRTSSEAGLDSENILLNVLGSWPLEQATHLDARYAHGFEVAQWDATFDKMPAVTTVIVKAGSSITDTLLEVLFKDLHMRGRRIITHIIIDAADVYPYFRMQMLGSSGELAESLSRLTLLRVLLYCAEASRAKLPLDTVEVIHDDKGHLLGPSSEADIDWSELYNGLERGFVHQGVMYNSVTGCAV
ncbi:hypothetical protein PENSPDRAFT_669051 [Peniophora sp. CONT]|nr:hypothetical protein PENSPDRAFT_669051 [Peniophora sp. CONT]